MIQATTTGWKHHRGIRAYQKREIAFPADRAHYLGRKREYRERKTRTAVSPHTRARRSTNDRRARNAARGSGRIVARQWSRPRGTKHAHEVRLGGEKPDAGGVD